LVVIPEGNLLLAFALAFAPAFAFLVVIPEGNLLLVFALAFALAFAFLVVIPEGNLLLAFALAFAFCLLVPAPQRRQKSRPHISEPQPD
jgi:hypothetical protein